MINGSSPYTFAVRTVCCPAGLLSFRDTPAVPRGLRVKASEVFNRGLRALECSGQQGLRTVPRDKGLTYKICALERPRFANLDVRGLRARDGKHGKASASRRG